MQTDFIVDQDFKLVGEGDRQALEISPNGVLAAYRYGATLAIHGSTWRLNPKVTRETYEEAYRTNPTLAERDFGAIPPRAVEKAVRDKEALTQLATTRESPLDPEGGIKEWFRGDPRYEYYLHIDLSKERDNTGLSLAHWDSDRGVVFVDFIYTLISMRNWELSFTRVEQFIFELRNRGFKLRVSFDGWQSLMIIERLQNNGIEASLYSVDRGLEPYDTLINGIFSKRVDYPFNALFIQELGELKLYNGNKYDHTPSGSKDTSDAVAGAVSRCIKSTTGSSITSEDIDRITQDSGIFKIIIGGEEGNRFPIFEGLNMVPRGMRFGVRIDAVNDQLVLQIGRQDRTSKLIFVDAFLVWDSYSYLNVGCESVLDFLYNLLVSVEVFAFSLNEAVPLEIVNFVQQSGKRFVSALGSKRGQNGKLIRSTSITRKTIQILIQQIKKGTIRVPPAEKLSRDLKHMTEDNQLERRFVSCLAGFTEFVLKQHTVGSEGQQLAMPTKLSSPRGMPAMTMTGGTGVTGVGGRDVDMLRARIPRPPTAKTVTVPANPNQSSLPSPLRGTRSK